MAAEGTEDLGDNGELTNPSVTELYDPEVADLPKTDVEESAEGGADVEESAEGGADVEESAEGGADGGDTGAPTASYTAEGEEEEEGEMPADFQRLWKLTSDNPQDFSSWTDLLQYCEQEGHMRACRQALNAFLLRYPLCYGYWKKFADLERRASHVDKAEEVCERGLKAVPLSVDLWIHYINLLLGTLNMNLPESTQRIRSVFEEAVAAAGWNFHSDRLWDLYAEWEKEQGNLNFVTGVYDQVLRVPTQLYNTHYEKLKTHLTSHPPQDVLSPEEYSKVRNEYKQSQIQANKERSDISAEEEERPPGGGRACRQWQALGRSSAEDAGAPNGQQRGIVPTK